MIEFDVSTCEPETYLEILENLAYYEEQGNTRAIEVFRDLKGEMERKCHLHPIIRSLNGAYTKPFPKPAPRKFTMRGMDILEINEDGSLTFYKPEEKTVKVKEPLTDAQIALRSLESPDLEESRREQLFPEICTEECPHTQCGFRTRENFGKPCQKQWEQYKTPPSQLNDPLATTRTLDPNVPRYHSPKFRNVKKPKKLKREMKESLRPDVI